MNAEALERVLALTINSPNADQDRLLSLVPLDLFEKDEAMQDMWEFIFQAYAKFRQVPREAETRSAMLKLWHDEPLINQASWLETLSRVYRKITTTKATLDELKDEVIRQLVVKSLTEATTAPDPIEVLTTVRSKLDSLQAIVSHNYKPHGSLPLSDQYLDSWSEKLFVDPSKYLKLLFPRLDKAAGGGFVLGELILIAAQINFGKTFLLINIVGNLLRQGKKVLAINMDVPTLRWDLRMYSHMTGIPMSGEMAPDVLTHHSKQWRHELGIPEDAYRYEKIEPLSLTVSQIRGLVRQNDDLYGPSDAVIIDYGDQILPTQKESRTDIELYKVFEGCRGIGVDLGKLMVVATQTNYEGFDPDKERTTTIKNLGDAKAKARAAQFGIAIDQTKAERLHNPPLCRLNVFKSTNGEAGITVPAIIDYKKAKVTEITFDTFNQFKASVYGNSMQGVKTGGKHSATTPTIGNGNYQVAESTPPPGNW